MSGVEDPDNPRLTVEDIKEIMSYDPEAEVDRLDCELHQQIQWKLEACKKAEDLQSKLTEMESVLAWAGENVWLQRWPERSQQERWTAYPLGASKWHNAPTLYAALKSAWEARDK